jgi:hypothetical protein
LLETLGTGQDFCELGPAVLEQVARIDATVGVAAQYRLHGDLSQQRSANQAEAVEDAREFRSHRPARGRCKVAIGATFFPINGGNKALQKYNAQRHLTLQGGTGPTHRWRPKGGGFFEPSKAV